MLDPQVESTAVVSFLEEAGSRMRKLWLTYSSQTTAILGALLGNCCPQLEVLQMSTGVNCNSTPLQLPVEALQRGCPQLQVFTLYPLPPATLLCICSLPLLPPPRCCGC